MDLYYTVNCCLSALGLYNFVRVFGWAYKWRGIYLGRGGGVGLKAELKNVSESADKKQVDAVISRSIRFLFTGL